MRTNHLIIMMGIFLPFLVNCQTIKPEIEYLTTQEFKKIIELKNVVLIDVRTNAEFIEGHITGAINIDVYDADFTTLVKSKTQGRSIALYCRSGNRSKLAASKLTDLKVEIYELNYGFKDWVQSGYSVNK